MKIAIVRSSSVILNLKDYNIQEIGLAAALLKLGVSVDVFMAGASKKLRVETTTFNGSVFRLYILPFIKLPGKQALFPGLRKILIKNSYDLIQVHEDSQITSVLISLWAEKMKVPVVLCQGMYHDYSGINRIIQICYDMICIPILRNKIKATIAKTSMAKNYLTQKGFKNISICPIGFNPENLLNSNWSVENFVPSMFREGVENLVYVGSLEKRRNLFFLIDLFEELLKARENIQLIIAGDGPEKKKVIKRLKKQSLLGKAHYLGKVNQKLVSLLLQKATAFLLCSSYEIYGMVILEAMYYGVPVFSTATAGAMDIISDGVNGFIIEELNIAKWKFKIEQLLNDKNKMAAVKNNAVSTIRNNFVWDKACLPFYNVYYSLISS